MTAMANPPVPIVADAAATPPVTVRRQTRSRAASQGRWWHQWLPRTMTGLVACGCLLVSLPMVVAVVGVSVTLQNHAHQSEAMVSDALRLERTGSQLLKELENLQRVTLQYLALEDAALLPVIERRRSTCVEILRDIELAGMPSSVTQHSRRLLDDLHALREVWVQPADLNSLERSVEQMRGMQATAAAVMISGREALDKRIEALYSRMSEARRVIRIAAITLVPLSGLLALVFSIAVTRPLRALRLGIVALGTSNYRHEVRIAYPREMSRLGEKLDWLRRRLQILEADKDRFLRHVSHELKTPLASIREGANLMIDGAVGPLNARQAEVMQILFDAAIDLERQIRNLLAYAAWRDGLRSATPDWFDARRLIDEVLAAHHLPMSKLDLQATVSVGSGVRLYGQRARLRIALDNLMSNAIKHAPAGSSIDIEAGHADACCHFSVRDRGRGIAEADRERVVLPFVRGIEREETGVGGTGVGLSIVSDTATSHGGELEILDAGPGACVRLVWPCPPLRV
jgi:two-component system sensor histidine kinase GlrK